MEKRLGKGLEALIPEDAGQFKERIVNLKVSEIKPNTFQPRLRFDEDKMTELKQSIKEKGVIQPVLVRMKDNVYELIAGERRYRAAKELQFEEIPAIVKQDVSDVLSLELSLIENIQREELNPIEEAKAFRELTERFEHTLEKIGQMVGKDKTTVSNSLRLLNLSGEIQKHVEDGILSAGHAKVLLSIPNEYRQKKMVSSIIKNSLSVRQAEEIAKADIDAKKKPRKPLDPEIQKVEEDLQHRLGTKVRLLHGKKRGRIEIQYFSVDDLQRLLSIILGGR